MHDSNIHRKWDYDYIEKRILDAIVVITIGVVLLLNTTGNLPWSIWLNFIKLWPLMVISIGINLIFSWSRVSRFIGTFITTIIFLCALAIAIAPQATNFDWNLNIFNLANSTQNLVEREASVELSNDEEALVKAMQLNVDMGIGSLEVSEDQDTEYTDVASKFSKNLEQPVLEYQINEDEETVDITFSNNQRNGFNIGSNHSEHIVTVGTSNLERHLNLKLGTGNGKVELAETNLNTIVAEVGAGNLEMDIKGRALLNISNLDLKVGVGNVTFKLDRNYGYKINYQVGLGSLEIEGKDISGAWQKDGTYLTENYEDSIDRVEINVEVGLGKAEFVY